MLATRPARATLSLVAYRRERLTVSTRMTADGPSLQVERTMTYVVDEKCIKCKTTDCVAVCPVNCF